MTLVKWNQTLPIFNNWMDNIFNANEDFTRPLGQQISVPAVNVSETEDAYQLDLIAPGKTKNDFNLEVKDGSLCISSEESENVESTEKNYTRKEYSYSSFSRSFSLPENIKDDSIEAKYEDGILKITIPKKELSITQSKTIEVA